MATSEMESLFSDVYRNNSWLGEESVSGPGSSLSETVQIRKELPLLLKKLNAKSLLDAPCGDFNWMQHVDLGVEEYIGADIVRDIIARHQQQFEEQGRKFVVLDITADELPQVDVILCRDCLGHFSYEDAFKALKNFKSSGSRYLLTTTFTQREINIDIETGDWRPLDLQLQPFNFPAPLHVLIEKCSEGDGQFADKSLGLWELATLPV